MSNYTCYICEFTTEDRKEYIAHVKDVHGEFIKRHVLIHKYNKVIPLCKECGAEVAFNEKQIDFNSYCVNHKKLAQIEWSKNNGFGAKQEPKQNLGKTKENCDFMKRRSESLMGTGVKAFTPEEIKENTAKRLATEAERGSRILKREKYNKWVAESLRRGMRVLTDFSEVKTLKSEVIFQCELCGEKSTGLLIYLQQSEKDLTYGCKKCTHAQIGEANAQSFRKKESVWKEFSEKVEREQDLRIVTKYEDYINNKQYLEVVCLVCGKSSLKTSGNLQSGNRCYFCSKQGKSKWEGEMRDELVSRGVEVVEHFKIGRKEIDLVASFGERKIGIELNGLYWHCEKEKGKNYHKEKHELAEANGLQLLQFYEDEWRDKKDIMLSLILSKLGVSERIFARNCKIVFPDRQSSSDFFGQNHLSGSTGNGKVRVGLKHDGVLVALVSFRPPFVSKYGEGTIEIARFATKQGLQVVGGFSRILTHSIPILKEMGYTQILTYSDKRTGTGNVYVQSGFTPVGDTDPDYFYTDFETRFNRFKFRAAKGLTEAQVAEKNKVCKIFGVGSKIFLLKI